MTIPGAGASGAAEAAIADITAPLSATMLLSDHPAGPAAAPTDEEGNTNAALFGILAEGSRRCSADTTAQAPSTLTLPIQDIRHNLTAPSPPGWKDALASQPESSGVCPISPANAIKDAVQSTSSPAAPPLRQQRHEQQQQQQSLNSQQQTQSQPAQQPVKQAPAPLKKPGNVVIQTDEEARLELLGGAGGSNGSPLAGLGRLMEWHPPLPHTVSRNLVRNPPWEHCSARLLGRRAVDSRKLTAFPHPAVPLFAGRPYLRA